MAGEAAGVGGAQVFVGAGMGMGVGLMQWRALKGVLEQPGKWLWSCMIGLAVPFLVTDVANAAGWNVPFSLHACVALGGLIVGAWQALILRQRLRRTELWTVASAVGWTLAGGTAAVADSIQRIALFRGILGAIAYLGIISAGGIVLGLVTSISLIWMLRREREYPKAYGEAAAGRH